MLRGPIIVCLLAAAYPVVIYPVLVLLVARLWPRPWKSGTYHGHIAHVIAVYNEEKRIRGKLENSLGLAIPDGCTLETIVTSDGSSDGTEDAVREFADRGVKLVAVPRLGKETAQIAAIRKTSAPIIVFSDASALIERSALVPLFAPFEDPEVLAVSGTDVVRRNAPPTGEDLYVRYEMEVRRAECVAGSLIGLSGCFFAVRRQIAEAFDSHVTSDMGSALLAIRQGGRAVAADEARCTYQTTRAMSAEFQRKRRTVLRGLWCIWEFRELLFRKPRIVAWEILSHKWCRFAVPVWLLLAAILIATEMAISRYWLHWGLIVMGTAAILGVLGLVSIRLRKIFLAKAFAFFTISLAAVLFAWLDFLRGKDEVTWTPTVRL